MTTKDGFCSGHSEDHVRWWDVAALRIYHAVWALCGNYSDKWAVDITMAELRRRDATITSLRASLDDAYREISRLSGEKHARDVALRRVIEAAESVHEGERAGE